ncbi:MAG TPA: hypothetical protein VMZ00_09325 [Sporichthya sp.]|nr:hypothetical protein [Sporichthya sp.]
MLRRLLVSAALVGSTLAVPVAAALPASASVQAHASTAACTYQQSGSHWNCVTPGAYCPKTAHSRYGYAKVSNRKYKCSIYSNGQWRWKRI